MYSVLYKYISVNKFNENTETNNDLVVSVSCPDIS